ncbi:hypothetical protein AUR66_12315 [Haloferax profundi]|uniref:Uncharacterized protein n=1 Tax=Haloferax profundi TaxID=1544718 RepID=A0A0W1SPI2_9EURY|nr:hypothetical protein AUR66_12315 [Haloferax profundi]
MHTLTISANGPVDYEFTVDGMLEPDTFGGDFAADSDDTLYEPDGPPSLGIRDTTGPRPEDAGGTRYVGDRFLVNAILLPLEINPEPGYDANVYLDEERVDPHTLSTTNLVRYDHSLMITANGPTEYELRVEGWMKPDTDSGDFSADSDDEPVQNGDGTMTVSDTTGPRPEDAGGLHFLGDRFRFTGRVEDFGLRYDTSEYDAHVYLDERNVHPNVVRYNWF